MKFLYLVWSNLRQKPLRTALTMLSIFVAFVLFGLLCAVREAFQGGVSAAGADRLIVRHKVSLIMTLPVSYGARMANIPGVAEAMHWTWFNGIYQDEPKNFFGSFPVEPEKLLSIFPEYVLSPEQKANWLKTRNGAIIGQSLVDRFGWKIGDRVPLKSPIWPRANDEAWEFEIVGVYAAGKQTTDTTGFFFRYDYFDEGRTRDKGTVGWYPVRVKDPDQATQVARAIDEEFANSPYETKAEPEGAFMQGFAEQIGNIGAILVGILSAVFFTILLVAGNTMAQAVRERTQELGVLKALGFTNLRVLMLVLFESMMMATLSGLAGLGAAWAYAAQGSPAPGLLPIFYLPKEALAVGVGLAVGLGLVAGIIPAVQAMRLQIAAALRRSA